MENSNAELFDNINDIIEDFRVAMLTVIGVDNVIHACPMSVACHEEETGNIYFATSTVNEKTTEIENNPHTAVTFQSSTQFVSLSGQSIVINDRVMIRELFNPAWEAWFPEGPEQVDIRLIKFSPEKGEYWDLSGMNGLKFLWNAGKAIFKDEKIVASDNPDSHGKVDM